MSVDDRVKSIIARLCGIAKDKISDDTKFTELGIDSVDSVELILMLEDEFGIDISPDEYEYNTVKDAIKFVENSIGTVWQNNTV